jgi:hypothetical protein
VSLRNLVLCAWTLSITAGCAARPTGETTVSTAHTGAPIDDASAPAAATLAASDVDASAGTVADDAASDARRPSDFSRAEARPLYYDRAIAEQDLVGRSLRELAVLRNMPYAKRGHRFRRPWLAQFFQQFDWYAATRIVPESELSAQDRQNAQTVGRFDATLDRAVLIRLRDALLSRDRRGALLDGDEVEAVLLAQRLGEPVALSRAATDTSPLDDTTRLDTVIARSELLEMSPRDLWILRNTIYARRGRSFRSAALNEYLQATNWYQPDPQYNDARLRRVDRQNLRLIQSVEAEIGGPTTVELEDSAMYGA